LFFCFCVLGLGYDIALAKGGLDVSVSGYDHKLPVLVMRIVEEMSRFATDPQACSSDLFGRMKEKSLRNLKNYLFWQPYYHCMVGSLMCLEDPRFSNAEKYAALEAATLSDFLSFVRMFVQSLKAQVLVLGNITPAQSQELTSAILEKLPFSACAHAQVPHRRVVSLVPGTTYVYRQHAAQNNPAELNSAVENIYLVGLSEGSKEGQQAPPAATTPGVQQEALLELLSHMVRFLFCSYFAAFFSLFSVCLFVCLFEVGL
jgi:insulysin